MGLVYSPVAPDSLSGLLSATPTATTPAGIYAMIAGTLPAGISALGDLFYWSGSAADPYCVYADAPDVIDVLGITYYRAPAPAYWSKIASAAPATYTSQIIFDVTGAASPTKPTATTRDYISVVDDGSGWCSVSMDFAWENAAGATPGAGIYLPKLPLGAPPMDLNYHKPVTGAATGLNNFIEVGRAIPGSNGLLSRSDGAARMLAAYAYDSTHFFMTPTAAYAEYQKIRSDWFQITSGFPNQAMSMAFRYKKA